MDKAMNNASTASRFDFGPAASSYEAWYKTPTGQIHDLIQKRDVSHLLAGLEPGGMLLDVGCGTGHWSRFFREKGYRVMGVDVSKRMVEQARELSEGIDFEQADAHALPFEADVFELVASMATLEFVRDPERVLDEMLRCAKPDGALIIGTLNAEAQLNIERIERGEEPYASARLFSPRALWEWLSPLGRVSMVASSLGSEACMSVHDLSQRPPGMDDCLRGPFLIAEVRL